MSRLEKARREKSRGRRKTFLVLILICLLLAGGLAGYFYRDQIAAVTGLGGAELVDREQTTAFIDFFGLTYIWVYAVEGEILEEVTADGSELNYNSGRSRWEIVLSGYEAGDELQIKVTGTDGSGQEITLTVASL